MERPAAAPRQAISAPTGTKTVQAAPHKMAAATVPRLACAPLALTLISALATAPLVGNLAAIPRVQTLTPPALTTRTALAAPLSLAVVGALRPTSAHSALSLDHALARASLVGSLATT
eukprot:Mycagemm_TRINITY_DN10243_c0_g1::TRINITY_DN10243_c0_g1_i1::g.3986::m.3986 type:complete len:118 gc:universal TRINITY_DN10243_c0_g1_i1:1083-730(-)